jgi:hypothetical protein
MEDLGARVLAPVGSQAGVGEVQGHDLAEVLVEFVGDCAFAAADLQRLARGPAGSWLRWVKVRSRFATQRLVSQRMAGLRAVYLWLL